jgi:hypothetical protein
MKQQLNNAKLFPNPIDLFTIGVKVDRKSYHSQPQMFFEDIYKLLYHAFEQYFYETAAVGSDVGWSEGSEAPQYRTTEVFKVSHAGQAPYRCLQHLTALCLRCDLGGAEAAVHLASLPSSEPRGSHLFKDTGYEGEGSRRAACSSSASCGGPGERRGKRQNGD